LRQVSAAVACKTVRSSVGTGLEADRLFRMSEAPMSIEPPTPSAEQLADWRPLVERIRQGDRSQVLAWDEARLLDQ
jgi:hypothetical protein